MICGIFSRITFKIGDVGRNLGRHNWPIWVMKNGVVDELAELRRLKLAIKGGNGVGVHILVKVTLMGLP